jgi:hypothetical protein
LPAATVIARRMGLSERPAVRVARVPTRRGGHVTLPLPPQNRGRHVWSFCSKVSRQIRAALAAHVQLLPAAGSTPASLCVQTSCATAHCMVKPSTRIVSNSVRETWWHKMPCVRNGLKAGPCSTIGAFSVPKRRLTVCCDVLFAPKSLSQNQVGWPKKLLRAYNFCSRFC